ncbi:MAG: tryptophan-rich sensory protein [Bernardetiaceae bacterium]|nr:tryptophan-rich sensory protein [Bernardetiaceae bacterium]
MQKEKIIAIILGVVICLSIGFASGYFSGSGAGTWYANIEKPFFQPPSWVFGPAWTLLYILMGVAAGLIWGEQEVRFEAKRLALIVFAVQLALNAAWSFLFFYFESPFWAAVEIVALWFMIVLTMYLFKQIRPVASYLMIPYLLWVSFASLLNFSIYYLNS